MSTVTMPNPHSPSSGSTDGGMQMNPMFFLTAFVMEMSSMLSQTRGAQAETMEAANTTITAANDNIKGINDDSTRNKLLVGITVAAATVAAVAVVGCIVAGALSLTAITGGAFAAVMAGFILTGVSLAGMGLFSGSKLVSGKQQMDITQNQNVITRQQGVMNQFNNQVESAAKTISTLSSKLTAGLNAWLQSMKPGR